jgi:hypothetical protein
MKRCLYCRKKIYDNDIDFCSENCKDTYMLDNDIDIPINLGSVEKNDM